MNCESIIYDVFFMGREFCSSKIIMMTWVHFEFYWLSFQATWRILFLMAKNDCKNQKNATFTSCCSQQPSKPPHSRLSLSTEKKTETAGVPRCIYQIPCSIQPDPFSQPTPSPKHSSFNHRVPEHLPPAGDSPSVETSPPKKKSEKKL